MVKIPNLQDPTLLALDAALEEAQRSSPRLYLGASSIGENCERRLWLSFRWAKQGFIEAAGLRRIEDGHRGEKVLARIGQGTAKPGKSAPWILVDATGDADAVAKANAFIAGAPAIASAPAVATANVNDPAVQALLAQLGAKPIN